MNHPLRGKRVVFVHGSLELGGAEKRSLLIARHLREACGAVVLFAGLGAPGGLSHRCDQERIPWVPLPRVESRFVWRSRWRMRRAAKSLKTLVPDIVLSYTHPANVTCGLFCDTIQASLTIWNQSDEGIDLLDQRLENLALKRAHGFLANSAGSRRYLECRGVDSSRIAVIANGIALPAAGRSRDEWRGALGLSGAEPATCMLANLHPPKDHSTLIRAWKFLVDGLHGKLPVPKLFLAGRPDRDGSELHRLIRNLGMDRHIVILGLIDDVAGFLAAMDLAVYSSRSEGCPNALLECMAAGLMVIGSNIPSIAGALPAQSAGCLFPIGDAQELSRLLLAALLDPSTREKQGSANKDHVALHFPLQSMTSLTERYLIDRWATRSKEVP